MPTATASPEINFDVTWEDQKKICLFSRLNQRIRELNDSIKARKQQIEVMDDAADEIYIADDAKIVIGESIYTLPSIDATESMLTKIRTEVEKEIVVYQAELEYIETRIGMLKAELKAKFKDSIHLENE